MGRVQNRRREDEEVKRRNSRSEQQERTERDAWRRGEAIKR